MPEPVGQVLIERPAAGDVEDLHPAADAEQRDPALERASRQRDLEVVTVGIGPDRLRMRLRAVALGVDVGAASQHQRVETVEQLAGLLGRAAVGRQHRDHPARAVDRPGVGERQQHGRLVLPDAEVGPLDRGADSDQGARHAWNLATATRVACPAVCREGWSAIRSPATKEKPPSAHPWQSRSSASRSRSPWPRRPCSPTGSTMSGPGSGSPSRWSGCSPPSPPTARRSPRP